MFFVTNHPMACATYSIEEVAKILGIGRSSAYLAARTGEIPTIKIGCRLLVPKMALEHMLAHTEDRAVREDGGVQ